MSRDPIVDDVPPFESNLPRSSTSIFARSSAMLKSDREHPTQESSPSSDHHCRPNKRVPPARIGRVRVVKIIDGPPIHLCCARCCSRIFCGSAPAGRTTRGGSGALNAGATSG